jgi:hypothetical protein
MSNYVVGHNMPGYLPESDPWITADWETARNALLEDMDRHADLLAEYNDNIGGELDELADLEAMIVSLKEALAGSEWGVIVGNTSYWLSFTEESETDENE